MNIIVGILVAVFLGYSLGCLQWSYLLVRIFKQTDIRKYGSGNAGASNIVANFGLKLGFLAAILDIAKASVALILMKEYIFFNGLSQELWLLLYLCGAMVVIGHMFPFYLGFRGGKGTASVIGMILALDWRLGLLAMALFVVAAIASNYIVIAVLALWISFLGTTYLILGVGWPLGIVFGLCLIVLYKHLDNLKRIKTGEEVTIRSAFTR